MCEASSTRANTCFKTPTPRAKPESVRIKKLATKKIYKRKTN